MSERTIGVEQLGLRCDRCGLEALAGSRVDQPVFHVFENGVLCHDCYKSGTVGTVTN